MNHLIAELLPAAEGDNGRVFTNADPITGQAAWYDLRVKITKAAPGEVGAWPQFDPAKPFSGEPESPSILKHHTHRPVNLRCSLRDTLFRR